MQKFKSTMKKIMLFCAVLAVMSVKGVAQKYGHLNFGNLVSLLPETKIADDSLVAYQKQLVANGEAMAKDFESKYTKFAEQVQGGTVTPVQQQKMQEELQKLQNDILQYEDQISQMVAGKREELLKPIIAKAETAIKDVAKANGYVMIFDTSVFNSVLYAMETDDLMPLLTAKLGIKMPAVEEKK